MNEGDSGSKDLRQSLTRLHATLSGSPEVDEHSKLLLRDLLGDIERLLKGSSAGGTPTGAGERLESLAARFEVAHPTLSGALRELVDLLARAGL